MRRIRTVLGLAAVWGAVIAGTWILSVRDVDVVTGAAVAATFGVRAYWTERRAQEQARTAADEAAKREASLIRTIERLTGVKTGPMPVLREVA